MTVIYILLVFMFVEEYCELSLFYLFIFSSPHTQHTILWILWFFFIFFFYILYYEFLWLFFDILWLLMISFYILYYDVLWLFFDILFICWILSLRAFEDILYNILHSVIMFVWTSHANWWLTVDVGGSCVVRVMVISGYDTMTGSGGHEN